MLKGKISEIYAILRDQAESSLTSLKSVLQKDLGCNFDDDQWDVVYKCVFFSFSSNKIIEQNYKFIQRIYLTPVRLSKIYPGASPLCNRFKTHKGTIKHIFWNFEKLKEYWDSVHEFSVTVLGKKYHKTPLIYLFGVDLNEMGWNVFIKRVGLISYISYI